MNRACLVCGKAGPTPRCPEHAGSLRGIKVSCIECGQPAVLGTWCTTHTPKPDEEKRAEYRKAYRDPSYHRERQAAVNRAKGFCERCGRATALQCDHIVPLRDGGTNTRANLQMLCTTCHTAKTTADRRRRAM